MANGSRPPDPAQARGRFRRSLRAIRTATKEAEVLDRVEAHRRVALALRALVDHDKRVPLKLADVDAYVDRDGVLRRLSDDSVLVGTAGVIGGTR